MADTNSSKKSFYVTHNYGVGKGVLSDKTTILSDLTKSKVLLVKNATQELGFKIITAFPVIQ